MPQRNVIGALANIEKKTKQMTKSLSHLVVREAILIALICFGPSTRRAVCPCSQKLRRHSWGAGRQHDFAILGPELISPVHAVVIKI